MPHEEPKLIRPGPEDRRCEKMLSDGQRCQYKATEHGDYCTMHGGHRADKEAVKQTMRGYRLAQWHTRVSEFAEGEGIKSLRDEIGIMRMTLEAIMLKCGNQDDLIMFAPRIGDMITRIEKIVTACHRLEQSSGLLLDRATALILAGKIVEILSKHVSDSEIIDLVASEIGEAITSIGKETN